MIGVLGRSILSESLIIFKVPKIHPNLEENLKLNYKAIETQTAGRSKAKWKVYREKGVVQQKSRKWKTAGKNPKCICRPLPAFNAFLLVCCGFSTSSAHKKKILPFLSLEK